MSLILACGGIGAVLGAVLSHPLTRSRLGRIIEGAILGALFGLAYVTGGGRLGEGLTNAGPVAAAVGGVILYSATLNVLSRRRLRRDKADRLS